MSGRPSGEGAVTTPPGAVDVHAHVIAPDLGEVLHDVDQRFAPSVSQERLGRVVTFPGDVRFGPLPEGIFTLEARLADLDRMQVGHQAISPPPFLFHHGLPAEVATGFVRANNDAMLRVAAGAPDRLSVLASLPMQDPTAALEELARIGGDPTVRGIAVGAAVDGANLDDEAFEPIWHAIEGLDLGVLVHPVDPPGAERMGRHQLRNLVGNPLDTTVALASVLFGGVLERCPRLRFCFPHGGGFGPYVIGRWHRGWERQPLARTAIDRSPREHFAQLYFDSLTHDGLSLEFLVRRVGHGRVLLGTDYLFGMSDEHAVDAVRQRGFAPHVEDAILRGNAAAFLRDGDPRGRTRPA